jgi:hypothetical protein
MYADGLVVYASAPWIWVWIGFFANPKRVKSGVTPHLRSLVDQVTLATDCESVACVVPLIPLGKTSQPTVQG